MTNPTHEAAPTEFVSTDDARFAYRRLGRLGHRPLLLCNYFAANMDAWDPKVTNGLAADREVILFDYAGIGGSTGVSPRTVPAMTGDCVGFCRALGLSGVDIVGFSLGGMIAQQLAHDHPALVRRMILLGTGPRGGEGMTFTELSIGELDDPVALLTKAFFTPSEASQAAGRAYLGRLATRTRDRVGAVSLDAAGAQLDAIREWGAVPVAGRFEMLAAIRHPTLVVCGNKDVVVQPINSFLLAQHMPDAQLVMYPDASHGAQSQHAEAFLEHARRFLES